MLKLLRTGALGRTRPLAPNPRATAPPSGAPPRRSWRTGVLAAALALLSATPTMAQRLSDYVFSQSNGTYTALPADRVVITALTPTGTSITDSNTGTITPDGATTAGTLPSMPGFDVVVNGTRYNSFTVSTNGFVQLGSGPQVSALVADLAGYVPQGAEVSWKLDGAAPNRTLTIQWQNHQRYAGGHPGNTGTGAGDLFNFQVKMTESDATTLNQSEISIVYGPCTTTSTAVSSVKVGINSSTSLDQSLRTTPSDWANSTPVYVPVTSTGSTAGSLTALTAMPVHSSVLPASGLTYTWTSPSTATRALTTASVAGSLPVLISSMGAGTASNPILRIQLPVTGSVGTLNLTGLRVTLNGSGTAAQNIGNLATGTNVRAYYSQSPLFSTTTATSFGTGSLTVGNSGVVTITGTARLTTSGTVENYIFITYDIATTLPPASMGMTLGAAADNFTFSQASASGGNTLTTATPAAPGALSIASPGTRALGYCTPVLATTAFEDIGRVRLSANASPIDNGTSLPAASNAAAVNRYSDFTGTVTPPSISKGSNYNLTVDVISSLPTALLNSSSIAAYIDLNQDNDFADAGENVLAATTLAATASPRQLAVSITVPGTATTGNTRLRIVALSASITNGCGTATYGEVEDYLVTIAPPQPATLNGAITAVQWPVTTPVGGSTVVNSTAALTNQHILQVKIPATGADGTITLENLVATSKNKVNGIADDSRVTLVRLFGGTSTTPATGTVLASGTFSGGQVILTPGTPITLAPGDNYFYVSYNIAAGGSTGDLFDAQIAPGDVYLGATGNGIDPDAVTPQPTSALNPAGQTVNNLYCTTGIATSTADENIGQVTFNGISNPGGTVNPLVQAPTSVAYTDYTQTTGGAAGVAPFAVLTGGSYAIDVTITDITLSCTTGGSACSMYGGQVDAYVDYNKDNVFTNSERTTIGLWTDQPNGRVVSGILTIPSTGVTGGIYRMRIIADEVPGDRIASTNSGCTNYSWGETEDYELSITVATCLAPSALNVTNITHVAATLGWTAPASVPASGYDYRYKPTASGTWITGNTSSTSVVLGSLLNDTDYEFQVRGNCGGIDLSPWAIGPGFRTECAPVTALAETFEAVTVPNLPSCWVEHHIFTGSSFTFPYVRTATGGAPGSTTAHVDLFMPTTGATGGRVMLVTPRLSNMGAGTHQVRFMAKNDGAGNVIVGRMSDRNNPNTFVAIQTVTLTSTYAEYTVLLTGYTGTDRFLAFRHSNDQNTTGGLISLDNITWETAPTCFMPTALNATAITATSATLNWSAPTQGTTPVNYNYRYRAVTVPVGTWVTGTVAGTSVAIPASGSLLPSTDYEFQVQSNCGSGDESSWTGSGTFQTACAAVTSLSENFDASTSFPNCWTRVYVYTAGGFPEFSIADYDPASAPNSVYMYASATGDPAGKMMLATPQLSNLGSAAYRLRFKAEGGSGGEQIILGTMSNPANPASFTPFGAPITLTNAYQTFKVSFASYVGPNRYIAFRHYQDNVASGREILIDDVVWEPVPSCNPPGDPTLSNVTTVAATINWTVATPAPANGYEVQYREEGAPSWTSTTVAAGVLTKTLSSLTANTNYEVQVRALCSAVDESEWSATVVFSTNPTATDVVIQNGNPAGLGGDYKPLGYYWGYERSAMIYRASEAPSRGYITSVSFYLDNWDVAMTTANVPVKVYLKQTAATNFAAATTVATEETGAQLSFNGMVDATTWNVNHWVTITLNTPFNWTANNLEVITETNYAGTGVGEAYDLTFRRSATTGGNTMQTWDADNTAPTGLGEVLTNNRPNILLTYGTVPTCFPPLSLATSNVTDVAATLSWSAPSNGSSPALYKYEYRPVGNPTWSQASVVGTSVTIPASGSLLSQTTYEWRVKSDCGSGDESIFVMGPNFTTACSAIASFSEDFDASLDFPECWTPVLVYSAGGFPDFYIDDFEGHSGDNAVAMYASTTGDPAGKLMLVSPRLSNLGSAAYWTRFYAKGSSAGVQVIVGTVSSPDNPGSFVARQTITLTTAYAEYAVNFASYVGPHRYLAFRHYQDNQSSGNYVYLDDIVWEPSPNCVEPSNLAVTNKQPNSVRLIWSASVPAPANGYEVSYRLQGAPTWTLLGTVTTTYANLTSLTASSLYEARVRAVCGPGFFSAGYAMFSFSTVVNDEPCDATVLPVTSLTMPNYQSRSNVNTTNSLVTFSGTCSPSGSAGASYNDVWFKVTVPANGSLAVDLRPASSGGIGDAEIAVATGACGGPMTIKGCSDDGGTGTAPAVFVTGLTPNTTAYIRVSGHTGAATKGAFTIAVLDRPVWTGAVSADATNQLNYTPAFDLPSGYPVVVLATATNQPTLSGTGALTLGGLTLRSTSTLAMTGTASLTLNGDFINLGTFSMGATNLVTVNTPTGAPALSKIDLRGAMMTNLTIGANGAQLSYPLSLSRVLTLAGAGNLSSVGKTLTLLSDATGTAMVVNSGAGVVTGTVKVQRYVTPIVPTPGATAPQLGYRHFSAPISNATINSLRVTGVNNFSPVTNPAYTPSGPIVRPFPNVFHYDETLSTAASFDEGWRSPADASSPMVVGKGYTAFMAHPASPTFTGLLNSGNQAVTLSKDGSGWNFLGNPYPAPIDADVLMAALPASVQQQVSVFVPASSTYGAQPNGQYLTRTPGSATLFLTGGAANPKAIAMGYGFWVRKTSGATSVPFNFTNAMRFTTYNNPPHYRPAPSSQSGVLLTVTPLNLPLRVTDETIVMFDPNATVANDNGLDGFKVRNMGMVPSIFTQMGSEEMAVNALPLPTSQTVVPVNLVINNTGTYQLAFDSKNLPVGMNCWLQDDLTGTRQQLTRGTTYQFMANASMSVLNRFSLVFSPQAVVTGVATPTLGVVDVYPNPVTGADQLQVRMTLVAQNAVTATLFNALGQRVAVKTLAVHGGVAEGSFDTRGLAAGVYTMRLTAGQVTTTRRVVVE